MACRVIENLKEGFIIKIIPSERLSPEYKWPKVSSVDLITLDELFQKCECNGILQQAIIQQYNEILLYNDTTEAFREILAPQCSVLYSNPHNLPAIIYPKFTPLMEEEKVWQTKIEDLPILLGITLERFGISFDDYKKFIDTAVDLCEEYNLREDDILLNPSNIGYHPVLGLRIIDYGLTEDNNLI